MADAYSCITCFELLEFQQEGAVERRVYSIFSFGLFFAGVSI